MPPPSDSIPPKDPHVVANTMAIQMLIQLVLALDGDIRELNGEIRQERASRVAATAEDAKPHELLAAFAYALRTDANARWWAFVCIAAICTALAFLVLSGVPAGPDTAAGAIIAVIDHHLPGGSP